MQQLAFANITEYLNFDELAVVCTLYPPPPPNQVFLSIFRNSCIPGRCVTR